MSDPVTVSNSIVFNRTDEPEMISGFDIGQKVEYVLEKRKHQLVVKRIFDILVSFFGLIVLFPVFILFAVLIRLDSKGPVFFRQARVGKNGRVFHIIKFRTMIRDAEKTGLQITVGKDIRVTRAGMFLRKYKLDELPQLINVLIGDMSFVGPRPEVPKYVCLYTDDQRSILRFRPGITDYASLEYRDENDILAISDDPEKKYIEEIMPKKIELNMIYLENISLVDDFRLVFNTLFVLLTVRGKVNDVSSMQ